MSIPAIDRSPQEIRESLNLCSTDEQVSSALIALCDIVASQAMRIKALERVVTYMEQTLTPEIKSQRAA